LGKLSAGVGDCGVIANKGTEVASRRSLVQRWGIALVRIPAIRFVFITSKLIVPLKTPSSFYEKGRTCPEEKYR
jgi:hypothetical protein